jgi:hypothetical protein
MKDENVKFNDVLVEHDRTCNYQFKVSFAFDKRFIAFLPALNLNIHSKTIEFKWLVFAIYIDL